MGRGVVIVSPLIALLAVVVMAACLTHARDVQRNYDESEER